MLQMPNEIHCTRGMANVLTVLHQTDNPVLLQALVDEGVWSMIIQGYWALLKQPDMPEGNIKQQGRLRLLMVSWYVAATR